jgi:hypothetical protein
MAEERAIKFATLHFNGKAHVWWFHGMTTLGHEHVTSYIEFTLRLMDIFDTKDLKPHFKELTHIRQIGSGEAFTKEFRRVEVMVPDLKESRFLMMYIEGFD